MRKLIPVMALLAMVLVSIIFVACGPEESLGAVSPPSWVSSEAQARLKNWFRVNHKDAIYTLVGDLVDAGAFWSQRGNAGTTPGTDFLGTTDDQNVVFKRNDVAVGTFTSSGFDFLNSLVFENDETISNETNGELAVGGDLVLLAGFQTFPENATNTNARYDCSAIVDYTVETTQTVCVMPANVNVVDVIFVVTALFDDSGTDTMDCGFDGADPDEFVDAMDVSSAGVNRMGDGADMPVTDFGDVGSSDLTVVCKYDGQNGNASAGSATLVVSYVVD